MDFYMTPWAAALSPGMGHVGGRCPGMGHVGGRCPVALEWAICGGRCLVALEWAMCQIGGRRKRSIQHLHLEKMTKLEHLYLEKMTKLDLYPKNDSRHF